MALAYILQQVGYKISLNPQDNGQRAVMLRFVNEAAKELYDISDMAGCLEEQLFKVNPNQTIAFPAYMGEIRAMRESFSHEAIKLSQMRPRYNEFNWEQGWRNWRVKNLQTLQTSLQNQAQLVIVVEAVETTPVVVNISGSTAFSSNISETITMTSTSIQTQNVYTDISALTKTGVSQYDVKLLDIDGNQVSYIPNDMLKAQFQIIDVSLAPWFTGNISSPNWGWVEVLYKKALPWFSNDNQEFPAVGYDNVIVNKCLQLWYEEQGNVQLAAAMYQKANQTLAQIHENANRGTDDMIALSENPHDRMHHRTGFGRDWRYAWRIQGR